MNKIFIDTNVIIDLLAKREPFFVESQKVFSLADLGEIRIVVSTLSIVNTHYVLNDVMKLKKSKPIIRKFKVLVESIDLSDKIIELSLSDDNFKDFEDGIQYHTAIEAQCDAIVTRNLKDFKKSTIPVLSPKEYLTSFNT